MSALDQLTASMSHMRHYRVLPWGTGLLTLLESIAKVLDRQVAKTGKSSTVQPVILAGIKVADKMLVGNFNLAITCALHATPLRTIMRARLRTRDLACLALAIQQKNSPIRQTKIPAKVSGYTVSSDCFRSFFPFSTTIMAEAITTQTRKNCTNHWVLHSLFIVIIALEPFFSDSQAVRC